MPRLLLFQTAVLATLSPGIWAACVPLFNGQSVKAVVSRDHPACFLVDVAANQAAVLTAEQPEDLEIYASGADPEMYVDGFEFGMETLTIVRPGLYRVRVQRVSSSGSSSPSMFVMSRKALALPAATTERAAEEAGTRSKRSQNLDDIAESLRLWTAMGDISSIARTHLKRGDALWDKDPAGAREDYGVALDLCRSIADHRCSAEAANNGGLAAQQLGDFDEALRRGREAVQDWRQLSDTRDEAVSESNVGLLFRRVGDFRDAIEAYNRAERILRSRDPTAHSRVINNIGVTYLSLAEFDKARAYFQTALAEARWCRSGRDMVRAQLNLGRTYLLERQFLRAESILGKALEESATVADKSLRADALHNLGQVLRMRQENEAAQSRFQESLAINQSLGGKRDIAYDLYYLGLTAQDLGEISQAREYLRQSLEIRRNCGLRDDVSDSLFALATLERDAGNLVLSRDLSEQALKLLESLRSQVPSPALRASYYSRKRRFFDLLVDIAGTPGPDGAADRLIAAEHGRGRALLDLLAEGSLLRQLPPQVVAERNRIQRGIDVLSAQLSAAGPTQEVGLRNRLELLISDDERVEAGVRESLAEDPLGQPVASVEQLQREGLPEGAALLEYHLGERQSYLWFVDHEHIREFRLPRRAEIEAQSRLAIDGFAQFRNRQRSPAKQAAFSAAMRRLSALLLGPLGDVTLPKRVILSPDGVLLRVPFAALELPHGHQRLGLTRDLIQVPSASYLVAGRKPRPVREFRKSILALSDPVFSRADPRVPEGARKTSGPGDSGLPRLPFTADLQVIEHAVPLQRRVILKDFDVNRNALERLPLGEFGLLHLSTHALIDDRIPEVSRVALSMVDRAGRPLDGFLRPYQMAKFHLDNSVVVLSACDTALGKQVLGEGLAGLASSLFSAGAAQLVLTLTEVDAEGASQFLAETYGHIFTEKSMPMEEAMTLARRSMAQSVRWSDPYYWAAFIIVGRPSDWR